MSPTDGPRPPGRLATPALGVGRPRLEMTAAPEELIVGAAETFGEEVIDPSRLSLFVAVPAGPRQRILLGLAVPLGRVMAGTYHGRTIRLQAGVGPSLPYQTPW